MKLLPPPGPERRRQLMLLGVLSVAAVFTVWYYFGRSTGPAAGAVPASNQTHASPAGPVVTPDPVKLAELEPVPEEPVAGRNPFRFGERPRPPAPPPAPPPPYVEPPPPPPPPPPQVPLQLVGIVTVDADKRFANVKDKTTGTQYNAWEGTVIDGKYRIVTVGRTSVVVEFVDGSGRRTIS